MLGCKNIIVEHHGRKFSFPANGDENAAVERMRDELNGAEKMLMYFCYVNCEVASRAITDCMEELFSRRDIYRQKVKQLANGARKDLYNTIQEILRHGDTEFLDNYAASVYEDVMQDVTILRVSLKAEMDKVGVNEAMLYSYINTAFVMLQYCVESYDKLMAELQSKYGHDLSKLYTSYCPTSAYHKWDEMFMEIFSHDRQEYDIDLNESLACRRAIDAIDRKLVNPDTIHDNIVKAYHELSDGKKTKYLDQITNEQGRAA